MTGAKQRPYHLFGSADRRSIATRWKRGELKAIATTRFALYALSYLASLSNEGTHVISSLDCSTRSNARVHSLPANRCTNSTYNSHLLMFIFLAGLVLFFDNVDAGRASNHRLSSIAIFNDVPAHLEVLAGTVFTVRNFLKIEPKIILTSAGLQPTPRPSVFANATVTAGPSLPTLKPLRRPPPYGLWWWLNDTNNPKLASSWYHLPPYAGHSGAKLPSAIKRRLTSGGTDLLICISPELDRTRACHMLSRMLSCRLIVALVHRADIISPFSALLKQPPAPTTLLALGPHVALAVGKRYANSTLGWAVLVAPYTPPEPCTRRQCLRGFAVQGSLRKWSSGSQSGLIRDYQGLWRQMQAPSAAALNITVLGKGKREDLQVPESLQSRVRFYSGLPYPTFWHLIHTSYALVPAFGGSMYLTTRISSTILASLTTCVPLVATKELLDAYSFLREEHVFLQRPGEAEADVMMRILKMPEREVFSRRRALCRLREQLGQLAAQQLHGAWEKAPHGGGEDRRSSTWRGARGSGQSGLSISAS